MEQDYFFLFLKSKLSFVVSFFVDSLLPSQSSAAMRQILTSELISKSLWVGETECPCVCSSGRE